MKFRPADTISERQLVLALAHKGRNVPLHRLTAWRKDGLLPPLVSTGLGPGAGRSYYWRAPDIIEQAMIVHDALARHGRADRVAVTLWLRGFIVPLPKFKRAWQSCIKTRKAPTIFRAPAGHGVGSTIPADLSQLLLQVVTGTAAAIQLDDRSRPALSMLTAAARRVNIPPGTRTTQVRQFWQTAQAVASVLAASDVVSQAGEAEMQKARHLLRIALHFVEEGCGEAPDVVANVLGETFFLYILALLRSGQEAILNQAVAKLDTANRASASPLQPLQVQA